MGKTEKILFISVAMVLFITAACMAQDRIVTQPKTEYSADEYLKIENTTLHSKIFYAPGKTRKDQKLSGMHRITILREDKGVLWVLMPEELKYMETPLDAAGRIRKNFSGGFAKNTSVRSVLGQEILNGIKTTKSEVTITGAQGQVFEGLMWQSENGIMVRIETMTKANGTQHRVALELKNIKEERQDPQLFEIPIGYSRMAFASMDDVIKNMLP